MAKIAQEYSILELLKALGRSRKALPSATATVDVTSGLLVKSNRKRKGIIITNISGGTIFIGIGEPAVTNYGIYLVTNGVWEMNYNTYSNKAIYAIASVATIVSIQEFE